MKCKIRITKDIPDIFDRYQPKVGRIYDAEYLQHIRWDGVPRPICVINILDKRIIVRHNEFEVIGVGNS